MIAANIPIITITPMVADIVRIKNSLRFLGFLRNTIIPDTIDVGAVIAVMTPTTI